MIRALVFSRDRALQLQSALDSFVLRVPDAQEATITVLYRATSAQHQRQYAMLQTRLGDALQFVPEQDFRSQVIAFLAGNPVLGRSQPPAAERADHCMFIVDDSIFIRPIRLVDVVRALESNPDALGFSFRLGRNTTFCYALGRPQTSPRVRQLADGLLKFRWRGADGDFGYPLEVSSSLYRLTTLVHLVPRLDFTNPNTLESQLAGHTGEFARKQPALLCAEHSVAFSAPLNRVQEVFPNRAGSSPRLSTDYLADLFDQGKRIKVSALADFSPNACHQEIDLEFE